MTAAGSALLDADAARRQHHRRTNQERRPIEVGGARSKDTRMTEQTVNIPLLRKAVEWAEAEAAKPWALSEWLQADWSIPANSDNKAHQRLRSGKSADCGTTYCLAGFIVQTLGLEVRDSNWGELAADALGLSYDPEDFLDELDGNQLFCANNGIKDVRRIAESIAGERL